MTTVLCAPDKNRLIASKSDRKVVLFNHVDNENGIACIGNRVRDAFKRVNLPIPIRAFDFLTIALSVTAADEFVSRSDGAYGFAREISLSVSLANPEIWGSQKHALEAILRFLTGDDWDLFFFDDGLAPPAAFERKRLRKIIDLSNMTQVCLFSGGLDSLIGTLNELQGHRDDMLLVSRATTGDHMFQKYLLSQLGNPRQFSVNDRPSRPNTVSWAKEYSTRARSILFLALAACCASAISQYRSVASTQLLIPENGFIALNPPMTRRRWGPLSTRTAHPHYLSLLQQLFYDVELGVEIRNPFEFMTKGEMIQSCYDQKLIRKLASNTVSCGKWKRRNQQCGKCVPCLIRRSSMYAAGVLEPKGMYEFRDLGKLPFGTKKSADLSAILMALKSVDSYKVSRWVSASGPLPVDVPTRKKYYDLAWRGLLELKDFLSAQGVKI